MSYIDCSALLSLARSPIPNTVTELGVVREVKGVKEIVCQIPLSEVLDEIKGYLMIRCLSSIVRSGIFTDLKNRYLGR